MSVSHVVIPSIIRFRAKGIFMDSKTNLMEQINFKTTAYGFILPFAQKVPNKSNLHSKGLPQPTTVNYS